MKVKRKNSRKETQVQPNIVARILISIITYIKGILINLHERFVFFNPRKYFIFNTGVKVYKSRRLARPIVLSRHGSRVRR